MKQRQRQRSRHGSARKRRRRGKAVPRPKHSLDDEVRDLAEALAAGEAVRLLLQIVARHEDPGRDPAARARRSRRVRARAGRVNLPAAWREVRARRLVRAGLAALEAAALRVTMPGRQRKDVRARLVRWRVAAWRIGEGQRGNPSESVTPSPPPSPPLAAPRKPAAPSPVLRGSARRSRAPAAETARYTSDDVERACGVLWAAGWAPDGAAQPAMLRLWKARELLAAGIRPAELEAAHRWTRSAAHVRDPARLFAWLAADPRRLRRHRDVRRCPRDPVPRELGRGRGTRSIGEVLGHVLGELGRQMAGKGP